MKKNSAGLTPQQEKFAQLIASGTNQSDAYRQAYDAKRMKAITVNKRASELAKHGGIAGRVAEIKAPVIQRARYELEDAMREAEEARVLALEDPKGASAAVSAVALKSKLSGLMVEDRKNDRTPFEDFTDDELDRATAATERAIAQAQGNEAPNTQGKTAAQKSKQN